MKAGWQFKQSETFDVLCRRPQAYCDDNVTYSQPPCSQDGEIPPGDFPSPAVGADAQKLLNTSYWGKRSMTNDFAQVRKSVGGCCPAQYSHDLRHVRRLPNLTCCLSIPTCAPDLLLAVSKELAGVRSSGTDTVLDLQVVYRMKLLGLNAVRVPFRFDQLNQELPAPTPDQPSEFFTCLVGGGLFTSAVCLGSCICTELALLV
jgi:hypothetical protein